MAITQSITHEQRLLNRDKKVQTTFGNVAPLWLISDEYRRRDNSFLFNVVYYHPVHGWINEHIRYDTFNDVLYHMGETRVSEESVLGLQDRDPYISGNGAGSTPNNPGNHL